MKKTLKMFGIVIALVLAVVLAYLAYLVIDYSRIEDNKILDIDNSNNEILPYNEPIRVMSLNFGFGAYSKDYSFFMDGGKYSRAYSSDEVIKNYNMAVEDLLEIDADIIALQEVDIDGTRSYHIDQMRLFRGSLSDYCSISAVNYDSSYLFYPFDSPHGANKSGIMTFSRFGITSAVRRSLPIETSLMKFLDLDRCYTKCYIPVEYDGMVDGKYLCVYNVHLSAYTSDGTVATEQLKMLIRDMTEEYNKDNYCIALGDFNMDLLGDSSYYFETIDSHDEYTWAKPINKALISPFGLYAPYNAPSCRNADVPYEGEGSCFVLTVDGMICSDNVTVIDFYTYETDFMYSDHQPIVFDILLKENYLC